MAQMVMRLDLTPLSLVSDADLIEKFARDCKLRRLSPETVEGYTSSLRTSSQLLREEGLSIRNLDKVSLTEVLQYLLGKGYAYNTLLQYFAALSGFCDYLIWEKIAQTNQVTPNRKRY